jgi:aryl-alcohol dehydrogenase-like predicted oxidoreductase
VLRRGEVATAITGASRPEQVAANVRASGVELGDDVLKEIDEALGDVPVRTPTPAPFATEGVQHR